MSAQALQYIQKEARILTGGAGDFDPVVALCEKAQVVLLGEATHGTHEFYKARAQITQRLIDEMGFNAVAAEADWPDSWRVNAWVRGGDGDTDAVDALGGFRRFPQWMWRNGDMLDFIGWLEHRNRAKPSAQAGFYGLDLYSLGESMRSVLEYLKTTDPAAARQFSARYACFDHFGGDPRRYGLFTGTGVSKSCEEDVVAALVDMRRRRTAWLQRDGQPAEEAFFCAEQNAVVVADAERYYRTMLRGDAASWNLRDRHMMDTLLAVIEHLERTEGRARVVVWAHNSHIGDARATQMSRRGEWNIGQLAREHFGPQAVLVGFTTYEGTVTAATEWDSPAMRRHVRPALPNSCERLFHEAGTGDFVLPLTAGTEAARTLDHPLLERAIGVIYRPETERESHYFLTRLARQFDAVVHFDNTRAVEPIERSPAWAGGGPEEVDETYPSGL